MFKATTIDNPEYQEFKDWLDFEKTKQVLHSHNDNPSYVDCFESGRVCYKWWHLNGKQHRDNNKPSFICYYESGKVNYKCWYLDGISYSEQRYKQILKQIKSMSDTEKLLDPRWWVREMVCLK